MTQGTCHIEAHSIISFLRITAAPLPFLIIQAEHLQHLKSNLQRMFARLGNEASVVGSECWSAA